MEGCQRINLLYFSLQSQGDILLYASMQMGNVLHTQGSHQRHELLVWHHSRWQTKTALAVETFPGSAAATQYQLKTPDPEWKTQNLRPRGEDFATATSPARLQMHKARCRSAGARAKTHNTRSRSKTPDARAQTQDPCGKTRAPEQQDKYNGSGMQ